MPSLLLSVCTWLRLRPSSLDEVVGQDHLLGEQGILSRMVKAGRLGSVIFWGPPGTGKTLLARAIAAQQRVASRHGLGHGLGQGTAGGQVHAQRWHQRRRADARVRSRRRPD